YDAKIATSIRYPEKFMMMGVFAAILFASQMLDRILNGDDEVREGAMGFALAAFTVAFIVDIAGFTPLFGRAMSKVWVLSPSANTNFIIRTSARDWIYAALRCGGAVALLATVRMRRRPIWLAAAAVFLCADVI